MAYVDRRVVVNESTLSENGAFTVAGEDVSFSGAFLSMGFTF
jgi:hypothetical protein